MLKVYFKELIVNGNGKNNGLINIINYISNNPQRYVNYYCCLII